jgi:hypothetical protein
MVKTIASIAGFASPAFQPLLKVHNAENIADATV